MVEKRSGSSTDWPEAQKAALQETRIIANTGASNEELDHIPDVEADCQSNRAEWVAASSRLGNKIPGASNTGDSPALAAQSPADTDRSLKQTHVASSTKIAVWSLKTYSSASSGFYARFQSRAAPWRSRVDLMLRIVGK